jgi:hypothetical protein
MTDYSYNPTTMTAERTVKQERRIVRLPVWMEFALEGKKISAIKALRETGGGDQGGTECIRLIHAKRIVEEFMSNIEDTLRGW